MIELHGHPPDKANRTIEKSRIVINFPENFSCHVVTCLLACCQCLSLGFFSLAKSSMSEVKVKTSISTRLINEIKRYIACMYLCVCRIRGAAANLDLWSSNNSGMAASQEAVQRRMRLNLYDNNCGAEDDTFLALLQTNGQKNTLHTCVFYLNQNRIT